MMRQLLSRARACAAKIAAALVLASAAVVGVGMPAIAEAHEVEPYAMVEEVKDTYKAFSSDLFYVGEYDVTYKRLTFNKTYSFTGSTPISYYEGWYGSTWGHITLFKCNYVVF